MQLLARVVFHQRSQAVVEGRVGAVLKNEIEEIVIDFLALGLAALSTTRTASSSRNEAARAVMRQFNSFQYEAAAGLSIPRTILFAGLRPARNFWSAAPYNSMVELHGGACNLQAPASAIATFFVRPQIFFGSAARQCERAGGRCRTRTCDLLRVKQMR